jgi:CheY-like chemotaxis protein
MAKILVVDDERLLRVMLKDALEGAGHAVVLAEKGRLAIDRAKQVGAAAVLSKPGSVDKLHQALAQRLNPSGP